MPSTPDSARLLPTIVSSAIAGMIARVPMHPVDTCKAKMQVQTGRVYSSTWDCLKRTFRVEGVRGMYPGFGITFFGSAPAQCLYFTTFEVAKKVFRPFAERAPFLADFCSGLTAEVVSCIFWVPIDVIKERLQVQSNLPPTAFRYKGNIDAIFTVARKEGLRGVYKGYGATVSSFGPFSAFYLMLYEQFKALAIKFHHAQNEKQIPFASYMLIGATAGSIASFITNPLDMAKLRMQVQRSKLHGPSFNFNYRHVIHGMIQIFKTEGPLGLWKGAGARIAFHAPSTAITLAAYEQCKKILFPNG